MKKLFLIALLFGASIYGSHHKNISTPEKISISERNRGTDNGGKGVSNPTKHSKPYITGKVSFYTEEYCRLYNPDCITASGERFSDGAFTCACSSRFNLGDRLRVSYKDKSVEVVCNDRGSFEEKYGRILDCSPTVFSSLENLEAGVIQVKVARLQGGEIE